MTCCRGWQIIFDDDTYKRYLDSKGLMGFKLRNAIKHEDGNVIFKNYHKECRFLNKDKKCSLQLNEGEQYMPLVCRVFPRHRVNYGFLYEEMLYLSCPHVGELFLQNMDKLSVVYSTGETDVALCVTNDDEAYFNELLKIRDEFIERIKDKTKDIDIIFTELMLFSLKYQRSLMGDGEKPKMEDCIDTIEEAFVFDGMDIDKMFTCGFYHTKLKKTLPGLYRLCQSYFKKYGNFTSDEAFKARENAVTVFLEKNSGFKNLERAYFIYYLYSDFLSVFEDYTVFKNIVTGIIHTKLVMLLSTIAYENSLLGKEDFDLSVVLAMYDRRGRHNSEVSNNMYDSISEKIIDFFKEIG